MYVDKVKSLVFRLLDDVNAPAHGFDHIERVLKLSLRFAEKETGVNKTVVALIALLHDVDDYKIFGKNHTGLDNAKRIMEQAGVDNVTQELVLDSINNFGYSKLLAGNRPTAIEGQIVSDADMCDAIGATGIIRTYTYSMSKGKPFFDRHIFPIQNLSVDEYTSKVANTSVCHLFEKILKLKNLMFTQHGKEEAEKRHKIMVSFLYHLFEEENSEEWISYLKQYEEDNRQ